MSSGATQEKNRFDWNRCVRGLLLAPCTMLWRNHHHHISSSSSLGSDVRHPNRITNRFYHRMLHNLYGVERFSFIVNTIYLCCSAYRRHTHSFVGCATANANTYECCNRSRASPQSELFKSIFYFYLSINL